MKIAVMTDSTAYLPVEIREKYDVHILPLSVVFDEGAYREGIDITTEGFYEKVRKQSTLPTTSQPPIGLIQEKLEVLAKDYDAVISIHLLNTLSGTYDAVVSAGKMVDGIEVYAYDSEITAMAQGLYVIEACEMVAENMHINEIIARLDEIKANMRVYFMVDDLNHLHRGGRMSGSQVLIGSLLRVKPILHVENQRVVPFERIRTRKKAINRIMSMLQVDTDQGLVKKACFIHGDNEDFLEALIMEFQIEYPEIETVTSYFGPVVGTHLGAGAIGICWYK